MLKKVLTNVNKQKSLNPYDLSLSEAGEEGLEPPSTVLETAALPLNYSPIFCCSSLNAPL